MMQEVAEVFSLDDDMVDGDLGDGTTIRTNSCSNRKKSQNLTGPPGTISPDADSYRSSNQAREAAWTSKLMTADWQQGWKVPFNADSLTDMSKEDLRVRLQESCEVINVLMCELDVARRYLEGKFEALKILQGKAILDKATTHTKSLLQKSEERSKALETEVNTLQWEVSFNQLQMKKCEQSWEQRYSRILAENKTLTAQLENRDKELQNVQAENSVLRRQCLEMFSMLNVKEQRAFQRNEPHYVDTSLQELVVLEACRSHAVPQPCPCNQIAAASRKQLIQLQQELDAERSKREEALMVADAFRIAFEQQIKKRSEYLMMLAEDNVLKGHNRGPLISINQRLRDLLPFGMEAKMADDLPDTLYKLLDLLNDKEEALAHQRKVSIMLAHNSDRHSHPQSSKKPEENTSDNTSQHQQTPACTHSTDPSQANI
uniref:coiled-coil domain-containing protein 125 isoform X2 n=1 Tax=Doryrhamphus excisus TaxID=161450 RepID=UPI0025AEA984|nr:coiled-coil domain-containing protein 125 isoform X2 [Doryrhamphus excisus]